jgi:uncharacterized protein YbjT (DUF2867 family)
MKVVVIGGTGLVGSKLIRLLTARGHEAVAASPSSGVDSVTGAGLAEALAGAGVVVDVTNSPSFAAGDVLAFFTASTGNLLAAERAAGVGHHVAVSIVGADLLPDGGYLRAKVAQERLIRESGVPYTILRATQFLEFLGAMADAGTVDGVVRASTGLIQPVAADEVAATLAEIVDGPPAGLVELAGPEAAPLATMLRRYLDATHDDREVIADPAAPYFGTLLAETSLVPVDGRERIGKVTLAGWLADRR